MSELNDFVAAQHSMNIELNKSLARIEQSQIDMSRRLFGGDGQQGALQYIVESAKAAGRESDERLLKVEGRVGSLESWKLGTLRWIAGVVAVLALEGTAAALYVQHIVSKFQK